MTAPDDQFSERLTDWEPRLAVAADTDSLVPRRRRGRGRVMTATATALLAALITAGSLGAPAVSDTDTTLSGYATVVDGDTIRLGNQRIRLWGIDAPERSQTCYLPDRAYQCGEVATETLRRFLQYSIICKQKHKDRYGRIVAQCTVKIIDGSDFRLFSDIGSLMVGLGWAVDYTKYSKGYYKDNEAAAKAEKLGMWRGTFQQPEKYRRGERP